jgi:hypothetical protein
MITYELKKRFESGVEIIITVTHLGNNPDDLLELIFEDATGKFDIVIDEIKQDMSLVRCANNSYWSTLVHQDTLDHIMKSKTMEKWTPKMLMGSPMPRSKKKLNPAKVY